MNQDRELARLAADLPREIEPSRDLWPQVADRISRGKVVEAEFGRPAARPVWRRPAMLAAAAVMLVALSSAVTTMVMMQRIPDSAGLVTPAAVVSDFAGVETEYVDAANEILRAVRTRRVQLSATTVAVLEKNLQVIDDAIRESRDALARDPANSALRDMVLASHRHKLDLLRRAAAVPAEL